MNCNDNHFRLYYIDHGTRNSIISLTKQIGG